MVTFFPIVLVIQMVPTVEFEFKLGWLEPLKLLLKIALSPLAGVPAGLQLAPLVQRVLAFPTQDLSASAGDEAGIAAGAVAFEAGSPFVVGVAAGAVVGLVIGVVFVVIAGAVFM
jgi:hypothetical protein